MKRKAFAFSALILSLAANSSVTAETLLSPAYIAQASGYSAASPFSMPSTQDLVGPIVSITSGLPPLGPSENLGLIYQDGVANSASITQVGGRHLAVVQQAGSNNSAAIQQMGTGHQAFVSQVGRGNIAIISQR